MNYEQDIGPDDDGWRLQTNLQPVIPFHLTENWNLISRTIIPVTHQEDIFPGSGSQSGLGDTTLSLFFNPKKRGGIHMAKRVDSICRVRKQLQLED